VGTMVAWGLNVRQGAAAELQVQLRTCGRRRGRACNGAPKRAQSTHTRVPPGRRAARVGSNTHELVPVWFHPLAVPSPRGEELDESLADVARGTGGGASAVVAIP